ncbi:MAG: hypothetical protein MRZ79_05450 [Bacteroidia bacterium]|nr:hypothetical protein [Bacteroidia bacterium]
MRIKRSHIAILLLSMSLLSCNKKKIEQLEAQNQTLLQEQQVRDSLLNDFASSFEAFEENLSQIREREQLIITPQENERRAESKDRIKADLEVIEDLLDSNKEIINNLNQQVDESKAKAGQFRSMVNGLKKKLATKDAEIADFKTKLEGANFEIEKLSNSITDLESSIASLNETNSNQTARLTAQKTILETQEEQMADQLNKINTGYMAIGTSKELKQKNIINKEGSFLGLGGRMVVEEDISETDFVKIDISNTTTIPLEGKKVELVSNHPSDSYTLKTVDGKVESIEIIHPDDFWKVSKFLVVVLN